jgi:molybdenum cofactor cytidylyltransferase
MSTRLGQPKQLLELNGRPLIAHVCERCLASGLDRVIVVTGHRADEVRGALAGMAVEVVVNPDFQAGQATSLGAGLAAAGDADAMVVCLGDQPGIDPAVIDRLIAARRRGALLGMAQYGEHRGHPVLFGREVFPELATVTGDQGGRDVLRRHANQVVLVPGGADVIPADVDTAEDYVALRDRWPTETDVPG